MNKLRIRTHKCKVVGASVDWLTCSASELEARSSLWVHGERLLQASKREGEPTSRWHSNGYAGRKGPHFAFGARPDSVCLQLSSFQADEEWKHCIRASENVSRLDLAVDTYFDPPVPSLSRQVYKDAGHRSSETGRIPKETLYVDTDGGSTLYVGARESENFGRLYDKGAKEKTEKAGTWWRWEVELKGRVGLAHSVTLQTVDDYKVAILLEVAHWFARRTFHTYSSNHQMLTVVGSRPSTTIERQLMWLAQGVRPTVASLVERVGIERVLFALGLPPQSAGNQLETRAMLKEA